MGSVFVNQIKASALKRLQSDKRIVDSKERSRRQIFIVDIRSHCLIKFFEDILSQGPELR